MFQTRKQSDLIFFFLATLPPCPFSNQASVRRISELSLSFRSNQGFLQVAADLQAILSSSSGKLYASVRIGVRGKRGGASRVQWAGNARTRQNGFSSNRRAADLFASRFLMSRPPRACTDQPYDP